VHSRHELQVETSMNSLFEQGENGAQRAVASSQEPVASNKRSSKGIRQGQGPGVRDWGVEARDRGGYGGGTREMSGCMKRYFEYNALRPNTRFGADPIGIVSLGICG
jgi:hypothetical protein